MFDKTWNQKLFEVDDEFMGEEIKNAHCERSVCFTQASSQNVLIVKVRFRDPERLHSETRR